jgi:hypothetical protein
MINWLNEWLIDSLINSVRFGFGFHHLVNCHGLYHGHHGKCEYFRGDKGWMATWCMAGGKPPHETINPLWGLHTLLPRASAACLAELEQSWVRGQLQRNRARAKLLQSWARATATLQSWATVKQSKAKQSKAKQNVADLSKAKQWLSS